MTHVETQAAGSRLVLHVGCGSKRLENLPPPFRNGEWSEIRLDIEPACEPDVIGTITDMGAIASESVDALFSSHNIEHVFPHEVPAVFTEFLRVLKPDGFAVVTCPDLQALGKLITEDRLEEPFYHSPSGPISAIDVLYGHRGAVARGHHYMAHRGGFTGTTLSRKLQRAGFTRVGVRRRSEGGVNLWALATRANMPDDELRDMMDAYFQR